MIQYSQKIKDMGMKIFELLSKALGPETSSYLKNLTCAEGPFIQGHYYLSCSEPELTMGTNKHTDSNVMTLLLQDQLGGLQVLHEVMGRRSFSTRSSCCKYRRPSIGKNINK